MSIYNLINKVLYLRHVSIFHSHGLPYTFFLLMIYETSKRVKTLNVSIIKLHIDSVYLVAFVTLLL